MNRERILDAALDAFSERGFSGATLDRIAEIAGLSKPNLLYYFASKEAIHAALLTELLETWLAPLAQLDPEGHPRAELLAYVSRKLRMSRDMPRESRLFASEIFQGAPRLGDTLAGPLKRMVDDKAAVIARWQAEGRLTPDLDPHHLVMSVWALTQHYADFEVQARAVLGPERDPWAEAEGFLAAFYGRVLAR
ncbi:TetR family transcriptional regulator C-terminal domain-containing protein [Paracoccus sp. S-4012]|uniref:TetR family transcriptional regulator C-terminal domain-containing protein n=1 Tax=Paracoccus sp. S-4012 TaxID=2665648 RepID=UPI001E44C1CF|nr:TetR family transcriptional regulator C-terminal domain-containing protein [Paracoccus sp. S-4012]